MSLQKPREGQKVLVKCFWSDTERIGTVQSLLNTQFTWVDSYNEQVFFTDYKGEWKPHPDSMSEDQT
jgi:hypothetical protein